MEYLKLEDVQKLELKLLVKVCEFCDEHELRYSLDSGTLLGAIRHKGFIPWDDDVDIILPRPDYEKFLDLLNENKYFDYCIYRDGNSIYPYLKILDKTVGVDPGKWNKQYSFDNSNYLWLDVFPLDGVPSDKKNMKELYRKYNLFKKFYSSSILNYGYSNYQGKFKQKLEKVIFPFFRRIGPRKLAMNLDKVAMTYDFDKENEIADVLWGTGEIIDKDLYLRRERVDFCGYKLWILGGWDGYLKSLYGDYMQLPSIEKRTAHYAKMYKI